MRLSIVFIIFVAALVTHVSRAKDRLVRSPSKWPSGTYGLPMAKSGCPNADFNEGTRYHDTEDNNNKNIPSKPYDLAGYVGRNMEQKFCIKTHTTANYIPWPRGKYCIFKKGNCPHDFAEGRIRWDDEDDDNENRDSGWLPDGHYNRNTIIYYCCRSDGYYSRPIKLPTDHPFVLLRAQSSECQRVKGMNVRQEWFYWDNEDGNGHDSHIDGKHPKADLSSNNLTVYYCYYY